MASYTYLSKEAFDKLKLELEVLRTEGRGKAARDIAEAREKGDLSENAEYDAAKEAQGLLELKINELEKTLSNARVLSTDNIDASKVSVFTTVTIKNLANGRTVSYTLVSEQEADLKAKKISVTSPIGAGLLGKRKGEVAEIKTPQGAVKFEVVGISAD